jgi:hypothetical protein
VCLSNAPLASAGLCNLGGSMIESATPEQIAYRQGYRDGWIASCTLFYFVRRLYKKAWSEIYRRMIAHGHGILTDWIGWEELQGIDPPEEHISSCAYCGNDAEQLEHVIPRSRGGPDDWANIVPACKRCNYQKGTKTAEEWVEECEDDLWVGLSNLIASRKESHHG